MSSCNIDFNDIKLKLEIIINKAKILKKFNFHCSNYETDMRKIALGNLFKYRLLNGESFLSLFNNNTK